jgi:hypothetical protein
MSTQRRAFGKRLAGVTLAAGLVMTVTQGDTPLPFGAPHVRHHAPISAHRNDDGTLKRGLRNEVETSNWSGYAVANYQPPNATYPSASATWVVPTVKSSAPAPVCHTVKSFFGGTRTVCTTSRGTAAYSSSWVGIGGFCENSGCTSVDSTLIQLGTEQDVSSNGQASYYAWTEVLPNSESELSTRSYPVKPGDVITASLECTANCTDGATQTWALYMHNQTEGWTYEANVSYASSLLSAEWIEEAPSSFAGVLPLADYGTATFDPAANGSTPTLTESVNGIEAANPYGQTSYPSAQAGNGAFSTCWGPGPGFASCPAPASAP